VEQLVPKVLDDLREVIRMTEAATIRVLDETEALVDDGRAAARRLVEARLAGAGSIEAVAEPIRELEILIERSNTRALAIMSALAQVGKIRRRVDAGDEGLLGFAGRAGG
jgi:hypothetical protein